MVIEQEGRLMAQHVKSFCWGWLCLTRHLCSVSRECLSQGRRVGGFRVEDRNAQPQKARGQHKDARLGRGGGRFGIFHRLKQGEINK